MKIKRVGDINKAEKVCFTIKLVSKSNIIIDKKENIIHENGTDITQECLDALNEYTTGNIEGPYRGDVVMAKILQGKADEKCLSFINSVAEDIILE